MNNHRKYADGLNNCMINDKDGHIPSPLIMFTCTALRCARLEWQKNEGVYPKASKSKLKENRPDRLNYVINENDGGKNASYCAATCRKLLTSPGIVATYPFLMNTGNTLPESYQQRVYKITLAPVKRQIQQAENPTPSVVISVESARVDDAILHDCLTCEVALEKPEIGSNDPEIPIDNNCTDDELHFRMPGGSGDCAHGGDKIDVRYAIPTTRWQRRPATDVDRFVLGTSDVDGYTGEDGDDADADEEEEASQANAESTQNVEDWGQSTFDLGTSDVDGYGCKDGDDSDTDTVEEASLADDGLMLNVED